MKCEAMIFSGQKNPSWPVTGSNEEEVKTLLQTATTGTGTMPPPALGYSGCLLMADEGSYRIFNGLIEANLSNGGTRHLQDNGRQLEKKLLLLAPKKFADLLHSMVLSDM